MRRTKGWRPIVYFSAVVGGCFCSYSRAILASLGTFGPPSSWGGTAFIAGYKLTEEPTQIFLCLDHAECFPNAATLLSPPEIAEVRPSSDMSTLEDLQWGHVTDLPSTSNPKGIKLIMFLVLFPGKQKQNSIFWQDRHSPAKYGTL